MKVIVVGAGSAGCVVAARLSEHPDCLVDLLEAGPDHSAANNTMALRGHPADYDAWAHAGNPGWGFAEVLPDFRRVEHDLDHDGEREDRLRPLHRAFLDSCRSIGQPVIADHNAPGAVGAGALPLDQADGVRQSAALTYLAAVRDRPNLRLHAETRVVRVLLDGRRAIGVELGDGRSLEADLTILCAGAYNSPAILLRSGIGPAGDLSALGIAPVHHLPGVGANLQDHPLVRISAQTAEPAAQMPLQTLLTIRLDPGRPAPSLQILPSGPASAADGRCATTSSAATCPARAPPTAPASSPDTSPATSIRSARATWDPQWTALPSSTPQGACAA
ncbi:MAG TPA: FAD-dependent oxidoreductase [Actinocrinis sp.]|jgi:choline dehydrogenase